MNAFPPMRALLAGLLVGLLVAAACTAAQGKAVATDVTTLLPLACDVVEAADPAASVVCSILDPLGNVVGQLVPAIVTAADARAVLARYPSTPSSKAARARARGALLLLPARRAGHPTELAGVSP